MSSFEMVSEMIKQQWGKVQIIKNLPVLRRRARNLLDNRQTSNYFITRNLHYIGV